MYGPHVGRDVLTGGSVAAGRGAYEFAVAIGQGDGRPIYLEFAHIGEGNVYGLTGAGEPFIEFVETHGIVEGVHAYRVLDGGELLPHVTAHALRRRGGHHQVGMPTLQIGEFAHEGVESGVAYRRSVLGVIEI